MADTKTDRTAPAKRQVEVKKGIGVRDLVTVGIFTVIYFIVFFVCASTGIIPIMVFLFPLPLALISGIPNILFYTKTTKFGMVSIMGILLGLLSFLMGYGPLCIVIGAVCGIGADLILRAGKYKSWKHMIAAHCVFSEWIVGTMLPMWIMGNTYFEPYRASQGDAFVDQSAALLNVGMLAIVIVGIVIFAFIGAYLGRAVLKKHFKRAGIA